MSCPEYTGPEMLKVSSAASNANQKKKYPNALYSAIDKNALCSETYEGTLCKSVP